MSQSSTSARMGATQACKGGEGGAHKHQRPAAASGTGHGGGEATAHQSPQHEGDPQCANVGRERARRDWRAAACLACVPHGRSPCTNTSHSPPARSNRSGGSSSCGRRTGWWPWASSGPAVARRRTRRSTGPGSGASWLKLEVCECQLREEGWPGGRVGGLLARCWAWWRWRALGWHV